MATTTTKTPANTLDIFFNPASVALIGASTNPEKLGFAVLRNLVESGYAQVGKVFPINPKADEILGLKAYPSVLAVPDPIDLAIVMVPYPHVPAMLREVGRKTYPGRDYHLCRVPGGRAGRART